MNARAPSDMILERMMSLHPKIMDLTLDRVFRLLSNLGDPHLRLPPVVHVAGTNGKGSTLAMIRAGLEGSGQTCHAYTSPHLVRFHERIRLAGELIDEDALSLLLDECLAANGPDQITFFEITTCAALLAFARTPARYTLLEVGLGGRLDATNVVDHPALSVITPVSIDHQQYLGETIEEIAFEKAGVLKPGAPAVIARQTDAALGVIEARAGTVGAPLLIAGRDWDCHAEAGRIVFQDQNGLPDLPAPRLPGAHQVVNAGTALAALRALGADEAACVAAMGADWPGRLQSLSAARLPGAPGDAEVWLDGGHNEQAGAALAAHFAELQDRRDAPLHMICGMLRTKDASGYLAPFAGLARDVTCVEIPGQTAATPAEDLADAARQAGLKARTAPTVEDALARLPQGQGVRVLVCGSLYFAGHVLAGLRP